MNLEQLKKSWVSKFKDSVELQTRIWDGRADEYNKKEEPNFENNEFLALLEQEVKLDDSMDVLDIGCGTGRFSNVIASKVNSVIGVDLSSKMVEYASQKAKNKSLENVDFQCMNWSDIDISQLNWENKFDIVYAHLTPAICDYSTFEKMNKCSKKFCLLSKPTRRDDSVLDKAFELIDLKKDRSKEDIDFLYAFKYLWHKGYSPFVKHEDTVWNLSRTIDETASWCIDRAKLRQEITQEDENKIYQFVKNLSSNGKVEEVITTKIATIYWEV